LLQIPIESFLIIAAYGGNLNIRRYADGGDIDPQIDPRRAVATRQGL
jgi:hypothetical protein